MLLRFVFLFLSLGISMASLAQPTFEDYPVDEMYEGRSASVNISSHDQALKYSTDLNKALSAGMNFAGAYSLTTLDCGSGCMTVITMGTETGWITGWIDTCGAVDYRIDSKLLIVNPDADQGLYSAGCTTQYYLMDGWKLTPLDL